MCVCVCVLLIIIIFVHIGGSPEGSEAGSRMGCTQRSSLSHFKHLQRAAPLSTPVANTPRGGGGVSRSDGGGLDLRLTAQKLQSESNGGGSPEDQALLASHYQCAMQVVYIYI